MEERASIIKLLGLPETFAVLLLTFSFILLLAPYFSGADFGLFKIPQFTDSARKKLKVIGPIVFLALVMSFVPLIPGRVAKPDKPNPDIATDPNTITILVANFGGPDQQNYLVTEKIIQGLRAATSEYSDISVQPLGETITEQTGDKGGSAYAREVGAKRKAGIVLWGYYGATSEQVDVSVYFEVLRPPERLSLRQNFETKTSPIADLKGFKIQTPLSKEMSYLVLLTVGVARYESGDYEGAISRFTKALAQSSAPEQIIDPADIYFYRGTAYYFKAGADGLDRAIADFDEVIKLRPGDAEAYYNRGTAHGEKGRHDLALADFDKAIKLNPNDADAYNNRGTAYSQHGQHDLALADFAKAVELRPDYADAYYNRGTIHSNGGRHDLALADFDKAIKLDPGNASAYYNRGNTHGEKGRRDLALADYSKAIELKPDHAGAYNNRGNVYYSEGQYDLALADFDRVIKLKPDVADTYNNRGSAYVEKGQNDLALADFDTAIKLDPDHVNAYFNRALLFHKKGELDRAIADLRSILRITNDPKIRRMAEEFLQELGAK